MITVCASATILFFGGWLSPFRKTGMGWTRYIPSGALQIEGLA